MKNKKLYIILSVLIILLVTSIGIYIWNRGNMGLKAEALNGTSIKVTWNSYKNDELYNVYRMDETNGEYIKISSVIYNHFTDTKLKSNSNYWYKVTAFKNGEEGKLSSPVKVSTFSLPNKPDKVTAVNIAAENINLKWNSVKAINKYYIYRSKSSENKFSKIGESKIASFQDTKLEPTTDYKYKITAVNKNGESEYSKELSVATIEKINEEGNTNNNLNNRGLATEQGSWVYFVNGYMANSLYKVRKDGTKLTKLYDGYISSINVVGDWIYFSNNFKIAKIKTDGSQYTIINDNCTLELKVIGEWIYYENHGINKMKIDGTEKSKITQDEVSSFAISGSWIYYSNISDKNRLYKIGIDGSNRTMVIGDRIGNLNIVGDYIFYRNYEDDEIYKINADGSGKVKVCHDKVNMFNVYGNKVYFEYWEYEGRLYKIDTTGENTAQITDEHLNSINIVNNMIFAYDYDNYKLRIIKIPSTNTEDYKGVIYSE